MESSSHKRAREAAAAADFAGEGGTLPEAADAKRLRPEDLLDLLDDDTDAAAAGDLASVMRSLEEEIASFDEATAGGGCEPRRPDLGVRGRDRRRLRRVLAGGGRRTRRRGGVGRLRLRRRAVRVRGRRLRAVGSRGPPPRDHARRLMTGPGRLPIGPASQWISVVFLFLFVFFYLGLTFSGYYPYFNLGVKF
ncbi:unnamed protein product [Urochloa humidicola]